MWVVIGAIAAVLSTTAMLPQVLKMWRTKSVSDLSPIMLGQSVISIIFWTVYGLHLGDAIIIAANSVSLIILSTALALYIRYATVGRRNRAVAPSPTVVSEGVTAPLQVNGVVSMQANG